ncbi:MAG: hypothetical protein NZL91_06390 [Thermoflexales bacterium]|nr:hypothetical protein [Thermoflexales bacterium]MCS7324165.1 hypothetical protein [Thermoflexales bacterium]MCX7937829.1 hypothetical protein [Thermoflexales bacterium]MDW8053242.1 hypothetical protein [Anaerolineae bacterium]MDW8291893.1 hypothetical protein [Anaerolineae bacterium]
MSTRLTEADIAWLEARLREAFAPVVPRAEFVRAARQQLMQAPSPPSARAAPPTVLLATVLALLSLVGVLWFLRKLR